MPFQKLPGNKGLIYIPEYRKLLKKNPCRDCFSCQWCGDERCRVCRPADCAPGKKKRSRKTAG